MLYSGARIFFQKGQSYLEYAIVIAAVAGLLFAMVPLIKRSIQAMTLTVADQIGNQGASDQAFDDRGHLQFSNSLTRTNVQRSEVDYGVYYFKEENITSTNMVIDLGFTSNAAP